MADMAPMTGFAGVLRTMARGRKKEPPARAPKSASKLSKNPRPLLSIKQQNLQGESGAGGGGL